MYSLGNNTYYGGFRTARFLEVFEDFDQFESDYENIGIEQKFQNENSLSNLWVLLCSRYGESHIAYNSVYMFKQALFSTIFMYGPAWEKRLELQDRLVSLDSAAIKLGTKAVHNHSYNPSTPPSTASLDELTTIDDQTTTTYIKGDVDAIRELWVLIETDVTRDFLDEFARLFIKVVAPDYPLLYDTTTLEENIREGD